MLTFRTEFSLPWDAILAADHWADKAGITNMFGSGQMTDSVSRQIYQIYCFFALEIRSVPRLKVFCKHLNSKPRLRIHTLHTLSNNQLFQTTFWCRNFTEFTSSKIQIIQNGSI